MKTESRIIRKSYMMLRVAMMLFLPLLFVLYAGGCTSSENKESRIQSNVQTQQGHTHQFMGTYRHLKSGILTFPLADADRHQHEVQLTAEQAAALQLGYAVEVTSTETNNHTHRVTLQIFHDP